MNGIWIWLIISLLLEILANQATETISRTMLTIGSFLFLIGFLIQGFEWLQIWLRSTRRKATVD